MKSRVTSEHFHFCLIALSIPGDTTYFSIDKVTGGITLIREVDRETSATLSIDIKAIDGGTPSRSADATVTFTVGDVNDATPVFDRDVYTANVDEGAFICSFYCGMKKNT